MKRLIIRIGNVVLLIPVLYIVFKDSLERRYHFTTLLLIWVVISIIMDWLLRNNEQYKEMRRIIGLILLIVLYFVFPTT